jgi:hypothetical protein
VTESPRQAYEDQTVRQLKSENLSVEIIEEPMRIYIDGRLRESSTGKTVDNINPTAKEVLGVATDAGAHDMDYVGIANERR